MGKFNTTQRITVYTENEEVLKYLETEYPDCEWEMWKGEIEGSCKVTCYYEPEVRYTKNGDGSPATLEVEEGFCEDYLEDEIKEKTGIEVRVECELDEVYDNDF